MKEHFWGHLTAHQALTGLCHLYLDAFGPLTVVEVKRALDQDGDFELLVKNRTHAGLLARTSTAKITRVLRKMMREGRVAAELEPGYQARYRLLGAPRQKQKAGQHHCQPAALPDQQSLE